MFDIGFSEIVVIGVVALVVIGPERLPRVARTLGHMIGRLQRYVNEVKADINREIELDELKKLQQQVQSAAREIEHSVTQASRNVEQGVRSIESGVRESVAMPVAANQPAVGAAPSGEAPVVLSSAELENAAASLAPDASPKAAAANARSTPTENERQPSLPGFDRI